MEDNQVFYFVATYLRFVGLRVKLIIKSLTLWVDSISNKSEKTEQINIFDEVEANLDETNLKEMTAIEVNNPKKKCKKIKDIKADEVIHHTIENQKYPNCGDNMV